MKKLSTGHITHLGFVLAMSLSLGAAHAVSFDLASDWSDASNPNGVWSYNDGGGVIATHLQDWTGDTAFFTATQPAWAHASSGLGHVVSWFRSTNSVRLEHWRRSYAHLGFRERPTELYAKFERDMDKP